MFFAFDAVTLGYGRGARFSPVIDGLSLAIGRGEIVALVGPNGCGKSTLLAAVPGLLRPRSGRVLWQGRDLAALPPRERARQIAYLAQRNDAPSDITVRTLVGYGRWPHERNGARDAAVVERVLEQVGLAPLAERRLDSLSGGERQRAWLGLALAQEPQLLLLDEPTTYLDIGHAMGLLALIRRLRDKAGLTVFVVLHDLNLAARFADRMVVMNAGRIVADGTPREVLTARMLREVFLTEAAVCVGEDGVPYFIPHAGGDLLC